MKKILIIRLSSIGDIVLTSPIIRCLKLQKGFEIHYLTKPEYSILLESNPYINKIHKLKSNFNETIIDLKYENYDFIIDLHNNIRSWLIKLNLRCASSTYKKGTLAKYLLIYFNILGSNLHIVEKYFQAIRIFNVINDNCGLDYFIGPTVEVDYNINQSYIAWSVGASYNQKMLSEKQIISVINKIEFPVVLLGGGDEAKMGDTIIQKSTNKRIYNFCGKLSLDQSAFLIKNSCLVLSNDTGLMHIAAAFKKIIISFWGCTKPVLGFYPYMSDYGSIQIVSKPNLSPCSKHGNYCKIQKNGCIKEIDPKVILNEINRLMKQNNINCHLESKH
ncbi:MAG: glycosyl transferase [Flavobacteriales bacterium]|nr:glycosyl transferase [Flavobacteriales bacterium]